MRRRLYNVLRVPMAIVMVVGVCSGCSRGGIAAGEQGDSPRREVSQSVPRSGGALSAQSKILTQVVIGKPVVVELIFGTDPRQDLWLDIAEDEGFELKGDYRRVLEVRKRGVAKEYIQLTPLAPGKQYLKMTVSHAGGDNPRSLVVILPVEDAQGNVPEKARESRSRVEFQTTPASP